MQSSVSVQFNTEVWQEDGMFVAYIPQLDLSSCGRTVAEAKKNIKEATELFFEETDRMGTTRQVLEEAGFSYDKNWQAPEILARDRMSIML